MKRIVKTLAIYLILIDIFGLLYARPTSSFSTACQSLKGRFSLEGLRDIVPDWLPQKIFFMIAEFPTLIFKRTPPTRDILIKINLKSYSDKYGIEPYSPKLLKEFDQSLEAALKFFESLPEEAGTYYFVGNGMSGLHMLAQEFFRGTKAAKKIKFLPVSRSLVANDYQGNFQKYLAAHVKPPKSAKEKIFVVDTMTDGKHDAHLIQNMAYEFRQFFLSKGVSKDTIDQKVIPIGIPERVKYRYDRVGRKKVSDVIEGNKDFNDVAPTYGYNAYHGYNGYNGYIGGKSELPILVRNLGGRMALFFHGFWRWNETGDFEGKFSVYNEKGLPDNPYDAIDNFIDRKETDPDVYTELIDARFAYVFERATMLQRAAPFIQKKKSRIKSIVARFE